MVQGADPSPDVDLPRQRDVVDAFLALHVVASSTRCWSCSIQTSSCAPTQRACAWVPAAEVRGATAVATVFSGRALGAQPAQVDGSVGVAWAPGGRPKVVWDLTIADGHIVRIDMLADSAVLDELDLQLIDD